MNTAVLYDACERAEAGSGELLAGQPLYSYSLKRFCFHSDIDSIAFVWRQEEEARQAAQYIEQWEKEYEIRKPVWILTGTETLTEALGQIRQKAGGREERKEIELSFRERRDDISSAAKGVSLWAGGDGGKPGRKYSRHIRTGKPGTGKIMLCEIPGSSQK